VCVQCFKICTFVNEKREGLTQSLRRTQFWLQKQCNTLQHTEVKETYTQSEENIISAVETLQHTSIHRRERDLHTVLGAHDFAAETLQHTAQHNATPNSERDLHKVLGAHDFAATYCNTLQHTDAEGTCTHSWVHMIRCGNTATHCNTCNLLQLSATHRSERDLHKVVGVHDFAAETLQHTATHRSEMDLHTVLGAHDFAAETPACERSRARQNESNSLMLL